MPRSANAPLLRVADLSVMTIGAKSARLRGVSAELGCGDLVHLKGASGSGKTTLLRALVHLEALATGTLLWRDHPVDNPHIPDFRAQVVYVSQAAPRFSMSVEASLAMAFEFKSQTRDFDSHLAHALCQRLRLPGDILSRALPELSGGEAQRIAFVRALLLEPTVLLLDEPASSLDQESRVALASALAEWHAAGERAAIVCSHDVRWVDDLVTHDWFLKSGGPLLCEKRL